jgi:hypothetical protein
VSYSGDLDDALTFVGDGGKGNDTVSAAFTLDPGSARRAGGARPGGCPGPGPTAHGTPVPASTRRL